MMVLAVIAILALLAVPNMGGKVTKARIQETINLVTPYQSNIENYYHVHQQFPISNLDAGIPEPDKIIGKYLQSTYLDGGALHMVFNERAHPKLAGLVLSLRPIFVPGSPNSPVSWVCGNEAVPAYMLAAGLNNTNLPIQFLPINCR